MSNEPVLTENIGVNQIQFIQIANDIFRVQTSGLYRVQTSNFYFKRVCGKIINGMQNTINEFHYKCGLLNEDINGND